MVIVTRHRTLSTILAAALIIFAVVWAIGAWTETRARQAFFDTVATDARLRQALLTSEIARFRLLPLALGDDRDVIAALRKTPGAADRLNRKLEELAAQTGAATIYLIDASGHAIATSNWRTPVSFIGRDYRFRRYYTDALATGAGEQFALGTVSRRPGLYLTRRTNGTNGVVVVKLEFDRIERQWRSAGGITYATNPAGVVLVTSRSDWRFAATSPIDAATAEKVRVDAGAARLAPLPFRRLDDRRIEVGDQAETLLEATTAADAAGWHVALAMPEADAVCAPARLARIAALLASIALIGLLLAVRERARRRAKETAALEAAVAERTSDLMREMNERTAADMRASELREALRQANRLATLGQVTASVAHETAQPVAAIRNYAASGETLLDRGDTQTVRENLRSIGRLTERIGRVTEELRGFARKGSDQIGPVPLADILEGAQLILKDSLSRVTVAWPSLTPGLEVMGGRVRLEQVLVILFQNAIEALAGHPEPRIEVTATVARDGVRLTVADNGPGIAPDIVDRIFTPFVTSRPSGLGLGLIIAQDIMSDLGGGLSLLPTTVGAQFEIILRRPA